MKKKANAGDAAESDASDAGSADDTAEMRTLNFEFAFNTGKLDVEGRVKGDSKPWSVSLAEDFAADFLRKLCNKMADALAQGNPSVEVRVDRDGHRILPEQ
jgi:hypothetical protein